MKKFLLIFMALGLIFCLLGCDKENTNNNSGNADTNTPTDTDTNTPTDTDTNTPTDTDPIPTACETNDEFADYILKIYKDVAAADSLYKSIVGDVSAPKVTAAAVEQNKAQWKEVIKNSISNPDVVVDVHVENGRKIYTFNPEKILNINGVGTHMGAGFPAYTTIDRENDVFQAKFACEIGQ